jgi:hypothetical protein
MATMATHYLIKDAITIIKHENFFSVTSVTWAFFSTKWSFLMTDNLAELLRRFAGTEEAKPATMVTGDGTDDVDLGALSYGTYKEAHEAWQAVGPKTHSLRLFNGEYLVEPVS